jgi:hypothetical protein
MVLYIRSFNTVRISSRPLHSMQTRMEIQVRRIDKNMKYPDVSTNNKIIKTSL